MAAYLIVIGEFKSSNTDKSKDSYLYPQNLDKLLIFKLWRGKIQQRSSPAYRWKTKQPKSNRSDSLSLPYKEAWCLPNLFHCWLYLLLLQGVDLGRGGGGEHVSHDRVADGYSLVNGEINEGPGIEINAWNEDHRHHDKSGGAGGNAFLPACPEWDPQHHQDDWVGDEGGGGTRWHPASQCCRSWGTPGQKCQCRRISALGNITVEVI